MKLFIRLTLVTTVLIFALVPGLGCASMNIQEKIREKVHQRAEQKTEEAIEKGLDEAEEAAEKIAEKKKKEEAGKAETDKSSNAAKTTTEPKASATSTAATATQEGFKSFSKYDFVPGDKVIYYEDFTQDAIGDFPARWNTNGTGEVVTLHGFSGRWLKWSAGTSYAPVLKNVFPDNYTLEFDLVLRQIEGSENDPFFEFGIFATEKNNIVEEGNALVRVEGRDGWTVYDKEKEIGSSRQVETSTLFGKQTRISVWVQKVRLRVYVNETKVIDLPRAFAEGFKYNHVRFTNNPGLNLSNEDAGEVYLSDVRLAVGAPDMRSKLITEGKLVTHGILFDANSDKIKPQSYGVLKEIATLLKENQNVQVKVVGHTDGDGDAKTNLDLSKRRAESVKSNLSTEFGIDATRMQTDGKGKAEPVSPNTTPEGKANNRRVEFIRL